MELAGAARLQGGADLVPVRPDVADDAVIFHADRTTGLTFAAAAEVDAWTMVVEPNGFLCIQDHVVRALSPGGER